MKTSIILLLWTLFAPSTLSFAKTFPKSFYTTLPAAPKGGTLNVAFAGNPISFNPLLETTGAEHAVMNKMFLNLYSRDEQTYEFYPELAEKVEESKDHKVYTFTLNKLAKWSDGTPVTTDDIEFTLQKINDPKAETATIRRLYEDVKFKKVDAQTFTFTVERPKFNTFEAMVEFSPIQKKQFEHESDFNKTRENLRPVVTGPYRVKSFSRDQSLVLEKVPNWWAKDLPQFKPRYNFDVIAYKIVPDVTLAYEHFIKGNLDFLGLGADQYVNQVMGSDKEKFGDKAGSGKALWAGKFPSDIPMMWFGVAVNQKNPILQSKKVRQALAYLTDYDSINQKSYSGLMEQCITPFGSHSPNLAPKMKDKKNWYHLDPKKAAALLKEDGWKDTDGDNILDKVIDGKKTDLKISIKYANLAPANGIIAQVMKEQFKKAGIALEIRAMDGAAMFKDFDEKQFDLLVIGWGGGSLDVDPSQLWSSKSIEGGSNKVSYSSPEVDKLIEQATYEFNLKKRQKLIQEIGQRVYEDLPYIFVIDKKYILAGFSSKIRSPHWVLKYSMSPAVDLFYY